MAAKKKTKPVAKKGKTAAKAKAKPAAKAQKAPAKPKASAKSKPSAGRTKWLDEQWGKPLIDTYARKLDTFVETIADGQVDDAEITAQEKRLVSLMREIEPQLEVGLHEKVTHLLCELTAYDIMQMLHTMQQHRPQTVFQG